MLAGGERPGELVAEGWFGELVGVLLKEGEAVGVLLIGVPVTEGVLVGVTVGVTVLVTEAELLTLIEPVTDGEAPILSEEVGVTVAKVSWMVTSLVPHILDLSRAQSPDKKQRFATKIRSQNRGSVML